MTRIEERDGGRHGGRLTRRGLLAGAGVTALGLGVGAATVLPGTAFAADAYTALRDRWRDILTSRALIDLGRPEFVTAVDRLDSTVDTIRGLVDRSATRTRVFTDMPLQQTTDSGLVTATYNRLRTLGIALATPASRHHDDADVRADVLAGLATANQVAYHSGRTEFDNWWDWEIGSSRALADCLVLLDEHLDATTRERYAGAIRHFVPDPWYLQIHTPKLSTGANRVDLCQAALVQGIASRSSARIQRAADGLPEVCAYVSTGDGFYGDGSFIQHNNVPYTGTYGVVLLTGMAKLIELLAGSAWAFTDPVLGNMYDAVERSFAPVIHDGRMMSFVNGRAVARMGVTEQGQAKGAIAGILQLARAGVVDAATAQRWRALCRGWLDRETRYGPYSGADVTRTALFSSLLRDTSVTPAPEPANSVVFRNMGRAVHRRDGWAFSIAMCCNRVARYEGYSGGDNLKGFHTGAGMTYLHDADAAQYSDEFWPTVDPYRLAGTTVDRKPIPDVGGRTLPTSRWAGGPVLADRYSAVGMTLQAATTDLRGKKSWFCFDEYVFAMGTGITGGSGYRVETFVENRNLHTDGVNALTVNGVEWPYQQGASNTWTEPRWAHLDGVAGYVFPNTANPLRAYRLERTGRYSDVTAGGSTTPITRRYLTLWLDHGLNPVNSGYLYLYIPKATAARTQELSDHRDVTIVSYNPTCHAVRQTRTGITMANFWDAPYDRGGISVDRVCGVIVQELDGKLTIAVAEPYRSGNTVRVTVTPTQTGYRLSRNDPQVTVVSVGTSIVLDVAPGTFGRTFSAEFTRTA